MTMSHATLTIAACLTLCCATLSACRAKPVAPRAKAETPVDCAQAKTTLTQLEDGQSQAVNTAARMSSCYQGGMADSFNTAMGRMLTSHPHEVLGAMQRAHLPATVIKDIAHSTPWKYVDKPCDLSRALKNRLAAVQSVQDASNARHVAIDAIKNVIPEVMAYCEHVKKGGPSATE